MAERAGEGLGAQTVVRSLAFYAAFWLGTVALLVVCGSLAFVWPRWTRPVCDGWSRWHRWCATRLLGVRVVIEGRVPRGAVLVAGKNESFFEAIDMPMVFDFPAVFAKMELMTLPFWGRLASQYGLIGVEREQGARALRAMRAAALDRAAQDRPLVIFPEGTRVPHGGPAPLQAGFAGVYKLIGLPVVPFAVDSGLIYHRWWKRAGTITYRFGTPIPPGLPRADVEARVQAAINALN